MAGAMLLLSFALAGCVSVKYQMTSKDAKPAEPLELKTETAGVELTLVAVIIHNGPGAWKREAYWDEYVIKVGNHTGAAGVIGSAELVGILELKSPAGAEPWELDRQGHANERALRKIKIPVRAGSTPGPAAYIAGGTLGILLAPPLVNLWTVSAMQTIASCGAAALVVYAPVGLTSHFLVDPKYRKAVDQEFSRRRLVLPVTIEPEQSVSGSLFFALTPGPQRLIVRGSEGGAPVELVLELKPLAGLHLKPGEGKARPP